MGEEMIERIVWVGERRTKDKKKRWWHRRVIIADATRAKEPDRAT